LISGQIINRRSIAWEFMSTIDEIKARIDIVDLVSETVQLRRSGKSYTGFCPFHANTRTPAFVVFPESGTWRCFGQCNEGGDIFRFVMKKDGWDFSESLRYLAEKAGVQLKSPNSEEQAAAEEHDQLRALLEDAVTFYRHQLLNTPAGKVALDYLRQKRNISDETIEAFGLGYAPNSWDATSNYFKSRGHRPQDLLEAGLVTERQREAGQAAELQSDPARGFYDRFRHRLMIPIRDERGRMAGFGARILNPDDVPKFLNSPQTPIFDKGHLLYGLDRARKTIRVQDQAVIVEGYLDVIALHQAGFSNVVSPMGTALTEDQLNLLKRFSRRIVLALDPDAAGNQATLRGLQIARQAMDHTNELVFDARGLMGYEARLQADIRVTTLPEGMDPDEVVNRDKKEWEDIVDRAKPMVIHVMETLASERDVDDPKVKTEIAGQVIPLIQDVANPIERDAYRQRLARLLRVDERALAQTTPTPPRYRPTQRRSAQAPVQQPAIETLSTQQVSNYALEAQCLGVLLRLPVLLYQVDRSLQKSGLGRLSPEDFQHADHQDIFRLLQESIDQDIAEPLNFVQNSLSLPMMELADSLLARTSRLDPNEERVLEDLLRNLLTLRKRHVSQSIDYLRFLYEEAQDEGDIKAPQYGQSMQNHIQVKHRLDMALGKLTNRSVTTR
jgi:DNA primase